MPRTTVDPNREVHEVREHLLAHARTCGIGCRRISADVRVAQTCLTGMQLSEKLRRLLRCQQEAQASTTAPSTGEILERAGVAPAVRERILGDLSLMPVVHAVYALGLKDGRPAQEG